MFAKRDFSVLIAQVFRFLYRFFTNLFFLSDTIVQFYGQTIQYLLWHGLGLQQDDSVAKTKVLPFLYVEQEENCWKPSMWNASMIFTGGIP